MGSDKSFFLFQTAETVEAIVTQLMEKQRAARAAALNKQLECGCPPDSTAVEAAVGVTAAERGGGGGGSKGGRKVQVGKDILSCSFFILYNIQTFFIPFLPPSFLGHQKRSPHHLRQRQRRRPRPIFPPEKLTRVRGRRRRREDEA